MKNMKHPYCDGLMTVQLLIFLLKHRGQRFRAFELAAKFNVSISTIYRRLDVITIAGIPISTAKGRYGGVYIDEEYKFA